ncbi:hypothetical protein [Nocardioides ungokensis]|uniref:hypothetical protein n=1 Tax=Nocardioides ungokensis TaxID=1643322 RepID=UPI0015DF1CB1|nr:hypothetical protein [Nocardioides ungokensis]
MRGLGSALLGVFCFVLAGFVRGSEDIFSRDPELHAAASYGLVACGLVAILAGGVAIGIRLARD